MFPFSSVVLVEPTVSLLQTSSEGDLDGLVFLVVLFALGLFLVYDGARKYQTSRLIKNTPTEKVRSIALGRTELHGTARTAGTTFDHPFTSGECLYRDWRVEEYRDSPHDDDHDKEWRTHDSGRDVAQFYLEDDTGQVLVDAPDGADFEISSENTTEITVDDHDPLPPEVRSFYEADPGEGSATDGGGAAGAGTDGGDGSLLGGITDAVSEAVESGGHSPPSSRYRRRFTEEVLPVDEEVYVFGGAEPRQDADGSSAGKSNADRLQIETDVSTDRFIISDRDESGIVTYYSRRGPLEALGGLAMSAVALYFLLDGYLMV